VRDLLGVSTDQRKNLDDIQNDVHKRLDKLFTAEQRKLFADPPKGGPGGTGFPSRIGEIMRGAEQTRLKLTDEQRKDLASLQKDVDEKVDKVLNPLQRKQLKGNPFMGGPPPGGPTPGGPGGPPQPGKILTPQQQDALKLTSEQKKQLETIQKGIDAMLDNLLTADQKKQLKSMQPAPVIMAGPGGPGRGGPPGGAPMFRSYRYAMNFPAFAGKNLKPGKTIEDLQKEEQEKKEAEKKAAEKKEAEKKAAEKKEVEKKEQGTKKQEKKEPEKKEQEKKN
jgi:hypothetical protein